MKSRLLEFICSPTFLIPTGIGTLVTVVICSMAPIAMQLALIGVFASLCIGILVTAIDHSSRYLHNVGVIEIPFTLARHQSLYDVYTSIGASLIDIGENNDEVFRDLAMERTSSLDKQLAGIAQGRIEFVGTETWRTAYEQILRSPGLHRYRSISFARTANYWQNEPGRQSMQVNYDAHDGVTLKIERIVILPDHYWPKDERFPIEPLDTWIREQFERGINVKLVRQSDISAEADLLVDLGI